VLRRLLDAVAASPDDVSLRLYVASVMLNRGEATEALEQCSAVLNHVPGHPGAITLLRRATGMLSDPADVGEGYGEVNWAAYEEELSSDPS